MTTKPNTSIESIVESFAIAYEKMPENFDRVSVCSIQDWLRTTLKADRERVEREVKEMELEMLLLQDLPESVVFIIKGRIKALNNQDKV